MVKVRRNTSIVAIYFKYPVRVLTASKKFLLLLQGCQCPTFLWEKQ